MVLSILPCIPDLHGMLIDNRGDWGIATWKHLEGIYKKSPGDKVVSIKGDSFLKSGGIGGLDISSEIVLSYIIHLVSPSIWIIKLEGSS